VVEIDQAEQDDHEHNRHTQVDPEQSRHHSASTCLHLARYIVNDR